MYRMAKIGRQGRRVRPGPHRPQARAWEVSLFKSLNIIKLEFMNSANNGKDVALKKEQMECKNRGRSFRARRTGLSQGQLMSCKDSSQTRSNYSVGKISHKI